MLDFSAVRNQEQTYLELVADLTVDDLKKLTHEMIDYQQELIRDCTDDDVVFVPLDPDADDPFAVTKAERDLAWTLGHVIVHITASSEESAYLAAELARGVPRRDGRSRYETPWETMVTVDQCRKRLEESRKMRLASLEMWPDEPDLDNSYEPRPGIVVNAPVRFVLGLSHDDSHLGQIREIIRQSFSARTKS